MEIIGAILAQKRAADALTIGVAWLKKRPSEGLEYENVAPTTPTETPAAARQGTGGGNGGGSSDWVDFDSGDSGGYIWKPHGV